MSTTDLYDRLWRDILSVISFFSPALNPLQRKFNISSREVMETLGLMFGRRAAREIKPTDIKEVLNELSRIWGETGIGRFEVESWRPLTIVIRDCIICGQLPELGSLYECSFHKGFLEGLLGAKLGRDVEVVEREGYAGEAGTWSRRFTIDIYID